MHIVSEQRARAAHYFEKAARSRRHKRKFLNKAKAWLALAMRMEQVNFLLRAAQKGLKPH